MKAIGNNTTSSPRPSFPNSCASEDANNIYESYYYEASALSTSIIMAILSPVTVTANALILAAVWKKTFARTQFHVLLSGLALTDMSTGLIAQPVYTATILMFLANNEVLCDGRYVPVEAIANGSTTYFISITILLITLMSVERWLHMSHRSSVTSSRKCLTVCVLLLLPIPLVVFRLLYDVNDTYGRELSIMNSILLLVCFFAITTAYLRVFRIIHRHQLQVQTNEPSQNFGQPAINLAKYKKSVVSILYILVVFCFCFLPFIVSTAMNLSLGSNPAIAAASNVSVMLLFLSSSLNPCLYLWRMNDIRNAVKNLVWHD